MISIKNLKHYYTDADGNEVRALDGVSLEIKQGEFVAVSQKRIYLYIAFSF